MSQEVYFFCRNLKTKLMKKEKSILLSVIAILTINIAGLFAQEKADSTNIAVEKISVSNEEVISKTVDQQPSFPGGQEKLMKFLNNNLKYPVDAAKQGIQGRCIVQFVVRKDGTISNAKILQSLNPSCDKECIRLITSMPKWIPGIKNGENVNVYYTIPIRFKMQGPQQPQTEEIKWR